MGFTGNTVVRPRLASLHLCARVTGTFSLVQGQGVLSPENLPFRTTCRGGSLFAYCFSEQFLPAAGILHGSCVVRYPPIRTAHEEWLPHAPRIIFRSFAGINNPELVYVNIQEQDTYLVMHYSTPTPVPSVSPATSRLLEQNQKHDLEVTQPRHTCN